MDYHIVPVTMLVASFSNIHLGHSDTDTFLQEIISSIASSEDSFSSGFDQILERPPSSNDKLLNDHFVLLSLDSSIDSSPTTTARASCSDDLPVLSSTARASCSDELPVLSSQDTFSSVDTGKFTKLDSESSTRPANATNWDELYSRIFLPNQEADLSSHSSSEDSFSSGLDQILERSPSSNDELLNDLFVLLSLDSSTDSSPTTTARASCSDDLPVLSSTARASCSDELPVLSSTDTFSSVDAGKFTTLDYESSTRPANATNLDELNSRIFLPNQEADLSSHLEERVPEPNMYRPNDVLLGPGGLSNHHEGNKRYRQIVDPYREGYARLSKVDKTEIAQKLVYRVQQELGARFVKKGNDGVWRVVSNDEARNEVSQALRGNKNRAAKRVRC